MKRRCLAIGLTIFAVWPLVHFGLTVRYGTDPWKLYGFAMYCVPGPMKTVRIFEIARDGSYTLVPVSGYTSEEQRVVDRFRERRRALGLLAPASALAGELLALRPDAEGAAIAVLSLELDRGSARLLPRLELTTHWRGGAETPFAFPPGAVERAFAPRPPR